MVHVMSEVKPVHRYKAQTMFSFGGAKIEYFPHGPEVVLATEFDAQRLRADTAEAERDGAMAANAVLREEVRTERLRADAAVGDANEAERMLSAAEQRIAEISANNQQLRKLLEQTLAALNPTAKLSKSIRAALNPNPEVESHAIP